MWPRKRAGGTVVVDGKASGQVARGMAEAALGSAWWLSQVLAPLSLIRVVRFQPSRASTV